MFSKSRFKCEAMCALLPLNELRQFSGTYSPSSLTQLPRWFPNFSWNFLQQLIRLHVCVWGTLLNLSKIYQPGKTKGGSITVLLTSCLTGLDQSVFQIKRKIVSCHTADSKTVKQEVNGTVILPPLVFSVSTLHKTAETKLCILNMIIFYSNFYSFI